MIIKVHLLNVFSVNEKGGNPAGVVLEAQSLSVEQKKNISKQVGYSETAFVEPSQKADFKVTFYTPTDEVDLCGHATVATYALMFEQRRIKPGRYTQELKAGVLEVNVNPDGTVIMEQNAPEFGELIDVQEVAKILSIAPVKITDTGLRPQIVSTGIKDIFVPIKDRAILLDIKADFEQMSSYNQKTGTVSFHVFTLDVLDDSSIAHCRNFAPYYGIEEEAATGSSSGALACYLFKYGKITPQQASKLIFEQGYSMDKPSLITVSLQVEGDTIKKVMVGGKAILFGQKEVEI